MSVEPGDDWEEVRFQLRKDVIARLSMYCEAYDICPDVVVNSLIDKETRGTKFPTIPDELNDIYKGLQN